MTEFQFRQVDVFARRPLVGNPVAVVLDAANLDESDMLAFARWTNLSETTFVLPPTDPAADYRLRIFSPGGELSFAGHPTLGSAHAWLQAGGVPSDPDVIVQQCGIGLVSVRRDGAQLGFEAPNLQRSGPVDNVALVRVLAALGVPVKDLDHANWVDNGPGFMGLVLSSADKVLAIRPDFVALDDLRVGVMGPHDASDPADFEVRAFAPSLTILEDPVTGSLNAGFATWLIHAGLVPSSYTVRQGTVLGREGQLSIYTDPAGSIWVSGECRTIIAGKMIL